jgi:probable F420-dependent oxidoreductase
MAVAERSGRAFRFGATAAFAPDAKAWTGLARRVEELGFSTLLCPDNVGTLSPFAALAAAAAATDTLRLGTFVLAAPYRTPAAVAWESASLDMLSGGRFELGLGVGRPQAEAEAARLGMPFGTPGERRTALIKTVEAVDARFADPDAPDDPDPRAETRHSAPDMVRGVQRPRPPVMLAGAGPRLLRLACEIADILAIGLPAQSTEDDFAAKAGELRSLSAEDFERLELAANIGLVGDEIPPWAARMFGLDPQELFRIGAVAALRGTPRDMADTLLRRRDRIGISYVTVNSMFTEQFAPVIELLADA